MARIAWVKVRLEAWGAWRSRREDSGLGFPRFNVLLSMGGGGATGYRKAVIPLDELDCARTDQAVESLRYGKSHLHVTLQHIYVRNSGIKAAAKAMNRAESTIKANLEQADMELVRLLEK